MSDSSSLQLTRLLYKCGLSEFKLRLLGIKIPPTKPNLHLIYLEMRFQPWFILALAKISLQSELSLRAADVGCVTTNILNDVNFALGTVAFAVNWILSALGGNPGILYDVGGSRGNVTKLVSQQPFTSVAQTINTGCVGATFYFAIDILPYGLPVDSYLQVQLSLSGSSPTYSQYFSGLDRVECSDGWTRYTGQIPVPQSGMILQVLLEPLGATGTYVLLDNPYFGTVSPPGCMIPS